MYKVYLSGPIAGLTYDGANSWREYAEQRFISTIKALNPLRCKEWARDHGVITDDMKGLHPWMHTDAFIGTRDHWDTSRSDLVLLNLLGATQVSIGSMHEQGIAHHARVPVILVMEDEGNIHEHSMVRAYSTMRFNALDPAIDCINTLLSA